MNILFTICGRAGSKGIKNKNIKDFLGFPLPLYTISAIDLYIKAYPGEHYNLVLNTDSNDLVAIMQNQSFLPMEIIIRDPALGRDITPKIDVIANCLEMMQCRKNIKYDMVVDLDLTSPLRTVQDIRNLIKKKMNMEVDTVFSVTDARRNPYFNMVKKVDKEFKRVIESSFNTRQEAPKIYDMNASLYAFSPLFLLSGKGIFDGKCDIIKMFDSAVLDLDHETDFELMQVIAKYLFEKYSDFKKVRDNISK